MARAPGHLSTAVLLCAACSCAIPGVEAADVAWFESDELPPVAPDAAQLVIVGLATMEEACWLSDDYRLIGPLLPGTWTVGDLPGGERELRVTWSDRVASYTVEVEAGQRRWFVLGIGGAYELLDDGRPARSLISDSRRIGMAGDEDRVAAVERGVRSRRMGTFAQASAEASSVVLGILFAAALSIFVGKYEYRVHEPFPSAP